MKGEKLDRDIFILACWGLVPLGLLALQSLLSLFLTLGWIK